jgi:predicted MFS family arabinose efflux permease
VNGASGLLAGSALQRYKVLAAGLASLMLVLGVARFAYTPLLPLMQQQAGLGLAAGGWLAALNYAGYLCGAVAASMISDLILKDRLYRIGLVLAVASTVVMGMSTELWVWAASRFIAGLASAAGMLLGTGLILNWLIRHDHRSELGIHFAGIGLGIALCAAAVMLMSSSLDWRWQWGVFSALGAALLVPAWAWLPRPEPSAVSRAGTALEEHPPTQGFMRLFLVAYFFAGVGYVVSATFIVAIIDRLPGMAGKGTWVFLVIGLAAAPACIVWDLIARRTGDLRALLLAGGLQTVGILLPVLVPGAVAAFAGAILFGGTFIGIVSLVLTMAGRYYPTRPAKIMGKMTVAYGIAQMLAPALTGWLAEAWGGYGVGLYLAAGAMLIYVLLTAALERLGRAGS